MRNMLDDFASEVRRKRSRNTEIYFPLSAGRPTEKQLSSRLGNYSTAFFCLTPITTILSSLAFP